MDYDTVNVSSFSIAFFIKGQGVTADGFREAYDDTVGVYTTPTQLFSEELIRQLQESAPEGVVLSVPQTERAFVTEDVSGKTLSGSYFGEVDMPAGDLIGVLTEGIRRAEFPHGFVMLSFNLGSGEGGTQRFIMEETADEFTPVGRDEWADSAEVNGALI